MYFQICIPKIILNPTARNSFTKYPLYTLLHMYYFVLVHVMHAYSSVISLFKDVKTAVDALNLRFLILKKWVYILDFGLLFLSAVPDQRSQSGKKVQAKTLQQSFRVNKITK